MTITASKIKLFDQRIVEDSSSIDSLETNVNCWLQAHPNIYTYTTRITRASEFVTIMIVYREKDNIDKSKEELV